MPGSELGKALAGVTAWVLVGLFAIFAVDRWENYWGLLAVGVAVVIAWAIGEYVTWREVRDEDR